MDDRRQALKEVRDLLIEEGWSDAESVKSYPKFQERHRKPIFKRRSFLNVLAFIAVVVNVAILSSIHDARQALKEREAHLSLISMRCDGKILHPLDFFLTVDGEQVWSGKLDTQFISLGILPKIKFDTKCIIQLWTAYKEDSGPVRISTASLIGQRLLSFDHQNNWTSEIAFENQHVFGIDKHKIFLKIQINK